MKKVILFSLSLLLIVGPALVATGETGSETSENQSVQRKEPPSAGAILGDFFFVRPFSVAAVAVGLVVSIAILPFSVPSGSVGTLNRKLVTEPFAYTFTRPLGEFPESTAEWP